MKLHNLNRIHEFHFTFIHTSMTKVHFQQLAIKKKFQATLIYLINATKYIN